MSSKQGNDNRYIFELTRFLLGNKLKGPQQLKTDKESTPNEVTLQMKNNKFNYKIKEQSKQASDYQKNSEKPFKENKSEFESNVKSSIMSIPDENFENGIEEVDGINTETDYFNKSSVDENESQTKDQRINQRVIKTRGRNQLLNKVISKASPQRSYEAFNEAKNTLRSNHSPKQENNLLTARVIPSFYQNCKEKRNFEYFFYQKSKERKLTKQDEARVAYRLFRGRIGSGKSTERSK